MGWQTESVVQLIAGNTVINPNGIFAYNSSGPGTGNLVASETSVATDPYGNHCIGPGWVSYQGGFASATIAGGFNVYTGSLGAGWTNAGTIFVSAGQMFIQPTSGGITLNAAGVKLQSGAAFSIPQSSAGITTVNQLVVALINVGILN